MKTIALKHKIPLQGKYHKGVTDCPHCDHRPDNVIEHIIGFADSNIGLMAVVECPKCFEKWRFHARLNSKVSYYDYFLEFIEEGMQKHYKTHAP